jgi:hypothetical protein
MDSEIQRCFVGANAMAWSEDASTCSNVVTGMSLEIRGDLSGPCQQPSGEVTLARLSVRSALAARRPWLPWISTSLSMQVR